MESVNILGKALALLVLDSQLAIIGNDAKRITALKIFKNTA